MQRTVGKAEVGVAQQNFLTQMRQRMRQRHRNERLARAALARTDGCEPRKAVVGLK